MRIPATRTSSNLAADALTSGIIKVRTHTSRYAFLYLFRGIGKCFLFRGIPLLTLIAGRIWETRLYLHERIVSHGSADKPEVLLILRAYFEVFVGDSGHACFVEEKILNIILLRRKRERFLKL